MIELVAAVFLASLLGSLHCAGMCGAFMTFAVATPTIGGKRPTPSHHELLRHAAYHGGRLLTYVALGAISGAVGAAIDLGGAAVGISRIAAVFAGVLMIVFGITAALRLAGAAMPRAKAPAALQATLARAHAAAARLTPLNRAAAIGLLTPLLPCGWLYAFVVTSAGTANPATAALTMAAFWFGTLPVMLSLGVGVQRLTGPLRRRLPLVTSLVLVTVGIYTVAGRLSLPAFASPPHAAPVAPELSLVQQVQSLDSAHTPCCGPNSPTEGVK